jgi:23S rRNA (uracil1939-C5)-methyltransferase
LTETLQVRVEKLVYGGEGLSHADGRVVFIPFALPGEVLTVEPVDRRKKWIRGRALDVLEPSTDRVEPSCPHFGICGGCHYQHISYSAQVRHKVDILRETLQRLGGLRWDGSITIHESPPLGYRNRAQWVVRRAGRRQTLGYLMAGTSTLCEATVCPVLSPCLARALAELRELLATDALPGNLVEVEAFADSADERMLLNLAFEEFTRPPEQLAATVKSKVRNVESLLLLDRGHSQLELFGPGYVFQEFGGHRWRVSHLSFFQVNRFLTGDLLPAVFGERQGSLAFDLFAGVGFFSIPLAKRFARVIAVDSNVAATRDLRANAEAAKVRITSHNSPVEPFLRKLREKPDLLVLDPPRAGLGAEAAQHLVALAPQEIAYLSCDPSTLARDLAILMRTGKATDEPPSKGRARYVATEIHLFDLFPQTYHIETLVHLRRES